MIDTEKIVEMQIIIGCLFVVFLVFLSFGVELQNAAKYTLLLTLVIIWVVARWLENRDSLFVFAVKTVLWCIVYGVVVLFFVAGR